MTERDSILARMTPIEREMFRWIGGRIPRTIRPAVAQWWQPGMPLSSTYLTIREAALLMHAKTDAVRSIVRRGGLPYGRAGRMVMIPRSAIERIMAGESRLAGAVHTTLGPGTSPTRPTRCPAGATAPAGGFHKYATRR